MKFCHAAHGAHYERGLETSHEGFAFHAPLRYGLVAAAADTIGPFVSTARGVSYKPNFVPGTTVGATNPCLQEVIPSYLYQQYANDDDLQA